MRVRGFEPRTERMLDAGTDSNLSQHGTTEPTLLLRCSNTIIGYRFLAYHSTRVRGNLAWDIVVIFTVLVVSADICEAVIPTVIGGISIWLQVFVFL